MQRPAHSAHVSFHTLCRLPWQQAPKEAAKGWPQYLPETEESEAEREVDSHGRLVDQEGSAGGNNGRPHTTWVWIPALHSQLEKRIEEQQHLPDFLHLESGSESLREAVRIGNVVTEPQHRIWPMVGGQSRCSVFFVRDQISPSHLFPTKTLEGEGFPGAPSERYQVASSAPRPPTSQFQPLQVPSACVICLLLGLCPAS